METSDNQPKPEEGVVEVPLPFPTEEALDQMIDNVTLVTANLTIALERGMPLNRVMAYQTTDEAKALTMRVLNIINQVRSQFVPRHND